MSTNPKNEIKHIFLNLRNFKPHNLMNSMYVKFIGSFLGVFFISLLATFVFTSVTQFSNIEKFVKDTVENRANNIRLLVSEQNISLEMAIRYQSSNDLNISIINPSDELYQILDNDRLKKLELGETLVVLTPDSNHQVLVFTKINGRIVSVRPDFENNILSKFLSIQRMTLFIPILLGSFLITLAVTMIVKPIKEISNASKKVATGDFNIELKVRGKDEIASLADNFNKMVKELKSNEYLHKDFVSNVSHEFKTPITSLRGYAKLLNADQLPDEKRKEYASIILNESERLSNLSSNLLKLSELDNEVIGYKRTVFSLSEQIRSAILLLQKQWEDKNISFDLDNFDDTNIKGDQDLLYIVWVNLLSNAINYSNKGGEIKILLSNANPITVELSDNGVGMTKDVSDKIFTRFYKADKSRNTKGTGLGLPIAKKIIELHGGKISVESSFGEGSKFSVILENKYKL